VERNEDREIEEYIENCDKFFKQTKIVNRSTRALSDSSPI